MKQPLSSDAETVLAVDPGRDKCGLAIVTAPDTVVLRRIVARATLREALTSLTAEHSIEHILLGHSTTARQTQAEITTWLPGVAITVVDETGSTLEARNLFWQAHPPRGWRRVVPLSLQVPPEPVDDLAAVVLARRYFG